MDDGSRDNSYGLCKSYAKIDNRVLPIHEENSGVSTARNTGLEHATGKYIYFCDCDDYVFIETLSSILPILAENDYDLITADYIYKFLNTGKTVNNITTLPNMRRLDKSEIIEYLITPLVLKSGTGLASLWNKFFLLGKIKENNLRFNDKIHKGEDWQFILKFLEFSNSAYYLPKILYEYRIDGSQTENKYKKEPGMHLFDSVKLKIHLSKKFNISVERKTYYNWLAKQFEVLAFSAKSNIDRKQWQSMVRDCSVKMAAKKFYKLSSSDCFNLEISRKYKIYSVMILLGLTNLLRFIINKT